MDLSCSISSQFFLVGISVTSTSLMLYHIFPLGASMMLAALATEAGLPDGVLNVVHGTNVSSTSLEPFFFLLHLYDSKNI